MNTSFVEGQKIFRCINTHVISDRQSMDVQYARTPVGWNFPENKKSEEGGFVVRAIESPLGFLVTDPKMSSGLVCFCAHEVPEDYTHFVVTSVLAQGRCAHVEAVSGDMDALISKFDVDTNEDMYSVDAILKHITPQRMAEVLDRRAAAVGDVDALCDQLTSQLSTAHNLASTIAIQLDPETAIRWTKIVTKLEEVASHVNGF